MVRELLDLMETHGISATWAIVGHLFLSSCSSGEEGKHPEIRRPQYPWHPSDWYDLDPASTISNDPTWYGSDLVEMIRGCSVDQEIGSHSFGHLIAGDPHCDAAAFESDLEASINAAKAVGVTLSSYVYPRNSIGHLKLLERHGFTAYRGAPSDHDSDHTPIRRIFESVARVVSPARHRPQHAQRHGQLVNVPQTYLFDPESTTANRLGSKLWTALVKRQLEGALRTGSLFHIWFHTHNLASNPDRSFRALDDLFAAAGTAVDDGWLENLTMAEVADRVTSP